MKTKNYLSTVSFFQLFSWDVKRYKTRNLKSDFPLVLLSDVLIHQNKKIKLDKDKEHAILGVNNNIGIFDAYVAKGSEINQPYKKMQEEWIAYNPYRINVGSIGIKLKEHKNEYISPAYVVFSCKEDISPFYLFYLFKTNRFNSIIRDNTTGSVRQNLTFDNLCNIAIPLPSLDAQNKIIESYNEKIKLAEYREKKAKELEIEIENYLFDELGLERNKKISETESKIDLISFTQVDRWSYYYLKNSAKLSFLYSGKYKPVKLRDFANHFQYGLSEKSSKESIGTPFIRMNNIVNSDLIINDLKYVSLQKEVVEKYTLNKEDLLFNRTNSKELVGKTAVFDKDGTYVFASYIIRVGINKDIANVFFINFLFNSAILQVQKDLVSRQITGQANINSQEMLDFLFPLPPLEKQNQIARYIIGLKEQIKALHQQAELNRKQAILDFENAIFSQP